MELLKPHLSYASYLIFREHVSQARKRRVAVDIGYFNKIPVP